MVLNRTWNDQIVKSMICILKRLIIRISSKNRNNQGQSYLIRREVHNVFLQIFVFFSDNYYLKHFLLEISVKNELCVTVQILLFVFECFLMIFREIWIGNHVFIKKIMLIKLYDIIKPASSYQSWQQVRKCLRIYQLGSYLNRQHSKFLGKINLISKCKKNVQNTNENHFLSETNHKYHQIPFLSHIQEKKVRKWIKHHQHLIRFNYSRVFLQIWQICIQRAFKSQQSSMFDQEMMRIRWKSQKVQQNKNSQKYSQENIVLLLETQFTNK